MPECLRAMGSGGWVVHDGTEYRVPGTGPLVLAVVIDTSGVVRLLDDEAVRAVRRARRSGKPSSPTLSC
jgi:hypothetical protein